MLDSISGAGSYGYNPYGYAKYNDDFLAQSYFNNNLSADENTPDTKSATVAFTGAKNVQNVSEETKKSSSKTTSSSIFWTLALIGGAFLAGKQFNKLKGLFKSTAAKETVDKTLEKANAMDARVAQNINTQHVNASTRKVMEDATESTITAAQQAAYDAEIAFKPMTRKQQKVNNANNARNAAERAEKNSVKNNSKGGEKLEEVAQNIARKEKAAEKITDGGYINPFNKNTYYTKNGKVIKIILANGNKEITDALKIAKHLDKHNINIETIATNANKKLNVAA